MIETSAQTMLDRPEEPSNCTVCCCTLTNKVLMVLFMLLLIVAILVGNLVTLTVVLGTKHFHTPQGYLKASLAVADLAVGIFVVPISVYAEVYFMVTDSRPEWILYNSQSVSFHPCNVIGPIFAGCTLVSITTIFLLTIERSIAVLKPLHKDSVITRKRTTILIIFSWLGSFFLAVFPMVFSNEIALEYNSCSRMCNYALGNISEFPSQAWNILLLFPAFDFTLLGGTVVINIISLSILLIAILDSIRTQMFMRVLTHIPLDTYPDPGRKDEILREAETVPSLATSPSSSPDLYSFILLARICHGSQQSETHVCYEIVLVC
uniref:G-protein coupled receptors family 1 profile domain-containing protein n=1 Tax=Gouania willdenowi TaxID=441366 RepID=A0A8C5GXU3_GOUWI